MLAVRRLDRRPERLAAGRFVVEGPQAVGAALAAGPGAVLELYYEPGRHDGLADQARAMGVEVLAVTAPVLASMADTRTPQGPIAVCPLFDATLPALPATQLLAVLDQVGDPGNAGTVIRTADAAGAGAVVLTAGSVDPHNPKCVRATAGSLWHLPVVAEVSLPDALTRARELGMQVLATSGASHVAATDLDDLIDEGGLARPTAWVWGAEAAGLSEEALAAADVVVRIPLQGRAESLNVSTAAAVCLYASARAQRRREGPGPRVPRTESGR